MKQYNRREFLGLATGLVIALTLLILRCRKQQQETSVPDIPSGILDVEETLFQYTAEGIGTPIFSILKMTGVLDR